MAPPARTSPARGDQPAVLWRASLAAVTGRFLQVEKWTFLALAALTLPAAIINQSTLWHLLTSGALDRAIRAFMLLPGNV